jgi:tetratricopeptide (TPR) repeat protein
MSEGDIQRWSREVAEDPGAPAFVRLARSYRRQGRPGSARKVVERGLAAHPEHVAGHALLALIQLEQGDRDGARDEWETVLSLDPGNFDGLRGLGFLALERNDLEAARGYLDGAARARPGDAAVAEAKALIEERAGTAPVHAPPPGDSVGRPDRRGEPEQESSRSDPARLFDPLEAEGMFLGGLVLDGQGRPLAGSLDPDDPDADELLGALLNGVAEEADRTTGMLGIGGWERLLIEGEGATLHASSLPDGSMLLVSARAGTPPGWVVRLSDRARILASRFLETAS